MSTYKYLFFDLYGTLIDIRTKEEKSSVWNNLAHYLQHYGYAFKANKLKEEYLLLCKKKEEEAKKKADYSYVEIDIRDVFREILFSQKEANNEFIENVCRIFRAMSIEKLKLYPKVRETLDFLKEEGYELYLISNAQAVFTKGEIEEFHLTHYFKRMVLSSEVGIKKPQVEILKRIMEEEKLNKEECIFIGNDLDSDIALARQVGIASILTNTDHLSKSIIEQKLLGKEKPISVLYEGKIEGIIKVLNDAKMVKGCHIL